MEPLIILNIWVPEIHTKDNIIYLVFIAYFLRNSTVRLQIRTRNAEPSIQLVCT